MRCRAPATWLVERVFLAELLDRHATVDGQGTRAHPWIEVVVGYAICDGNLEDAVEFLLQLGDPGRHASIRDNDDRRAAVHGPRLLVGQLVARHDLLDPFGCPSDAIRGGAGFAGATSVGPDISLN